MAEEYKDKDKVAAVPVTSAVPVAERGAEAYTPVRKAFPIWIPVLIGLLMLPVLWYAFGRHNTPDNAANNAATPVTQRTAVNNTPPANVTAPPAGDSTSAAADAATTPGDNAKVFSGKDIATGSTASASSAGEPLTDVTQFTAATDKMAYVGRKVKLTDVAVQKIVTDNAFFVGTSDNQRLLVILEKSMDAGVVAHKVQIVQGGMVSLTGVLAQMPAPEAAEQAKLATGDNVASIQNETVFLHATVVQKK